MPLFFFAGGAANAITWRAKRHEGYGKWLWGRASRLLRPLWVYLAIMAPIAMLVAMFSSNATSAPLLLLTTQLLWFLGAYLVVTALGPVLVRLHEWHPLVTLISLGAVAGLVDIGRFYAGLPTALGLLNFVVVWAFASQLGVWYVDQKVRRVVAASFVVVGLVVNELLVQLAHYPISMVGMPGDKFSNMAPPTFVLLVHSSVVCLVAILCAPWLRRVAQRVYVWRYAVAVNTMAMTFYLWHLPVLILLVVTERVLGVSLPVHANHSGVLAAGQHYWLWWPLHLAVFATVVLLVVRVMWISENATLPLWDAKLRANKVPRRVGYALCGVGVTTCGIGLLVLSATGLAGFPFRVTTYAGLPLSSGLGLSVLAVGACLLRYGAGADVEKTSPTT